MVTKRTALAVTLLGAALVVAGAALVYPPAGFVVAGCLTVAFGLFGIEVAE